MSSLSLHNLRAASLSTKLPGFSASGLPLPSTQAAPPGSRAALLHDLAQILGVHRTLESIMPKGVAFHHAGAELGHKTAVVYRDRVLCMHAEAWKLLMMRDFAGCMILERLQHDSAYPFIQRSINVRHAYLSLTLGCLHHVLSSIQL